MISDQDRLSQEALYSVEQGAFDNALSTLNYLAHKYPEATEDVRFSALRAIVRELAILADELKQTGAGGPDEVESRLHLLEEKALEVSEPALLQAVHGLRKRIAAAASSSQAANGDIRIDERGSDDRRDGLLGSSSDGHQAVIPAVRSPLSDPFDQPATREFLVQRTILQESSSFSLESLVATSRDVLDAVSARFFHFPLAIGLGLLIVISLPIIAPYIVGHYGANFPEVGGWGFVAAFYRFTSLPTWPDGVGEIALSQPRLYTYILGLLFLLFGVNDVVSRIFNIGLGVGALVALYGVTYRLTNSRLTATIAFLLAALVPLTVSNYLVNAYYENALPIFYMTALFFALNRPPARLRLLALCAFALAVLSKGSALVLMPSLIWEFWRASRNLWVRVGWSLSVIGVYGAIYGAWQLLARSHGASGSLYYYYSGRLGAVALLSESNWNAYVAAYAPMSVPFLGLAAVGLFTTGRRHVPMALLLVSLLGFNFISGFGTLPMILYPLVLPLAFFAAQPISWGIQNLARLIFDPSSVHPNLLANSALLIGCFLTTAPVLLIAFNWWNQMPRVLDDSSRSDINYEVGSYLATKLGIHEPISYGFDLADNLILAYYLAQAGRVETRPYFYLGDQPADSVIKPEFFADRGVRYVVMSNEGGRSIRSDLKRALVTSFATDRTFSDPHGTVITIYDVTRPAPPRTPFTIWENKAESLDGWSATAGASLGVDVEQHSEGQHSLKLRAANVNHNCAQYTFPSPVNLSSAEYFSLSLKREVFLNDFALPNLTIESGTPNAADWGRAYWNLDNTGDNWRQLDVVLGEPTYHWGLDLSRVTSFSFCIDRRAPRDFSFWLDDVKAIGYQ